MKKSLLSPYQTLIEVLIPKKDLQDPKEDLVMAPYLPILTVVLTGTGLVTGLISVSVALIVVAVVIVITLKGDTSFKRLFNASEPVGLLLIVFGAAVAAAGLAGLVQFSPAVAAFLVGLLLTGELAEVARRRLDPLRELLAAIFFVYFDRCNLISKGLYIHR